MLKNNNHRIVCYGEVLWDILPQGAEPGGAPINVAYHLHKQGKNPALITRIGVDEEGKKLLNIFKDFGVNTDYFQLDYDQPTGKVFAEPNEHNEVVYDIVKPVAWDFISYTEELSSITKDASYFIFGSLAARSKTSRETLFSLLEDANTKVLDINLRAPHYDKKIVRSLLTKADFVKMNLAELELITGWFSKYSSMEDRMKNIMEQFKIENLVVTMGGDGAMICMDGKMHRHNGYKVDVVDTVGSGDAFLAGLLSKLLEKATLEEALDFASRLGAFIATQRGACPAYETGAINKFAGIKTY
ncbi:MAG TPA: carbohydrate kinase [Ferruginibacter sp.]|nr:carbohydrate kinase [Ferruginibacter sp.]